ncbi:MAG: hypothetical protein K6A65_08690, partial [Succinivibrionaceae bacterium]|nr:hypothetical protein [Succinivibrionaceae bacterium]
MAFCNGRVGSEWTPRPDQNAANQQIFKDGTISLNGQFYKVRPGHGEPGDRVTIAYRTDNPGDVEICITSTDDEMRDGAP